MFDCACDYGDEMFSVFNIKTVKARKVHYCQDCGESIKPGQKYDSWSGLYEGKWESGKICSVCIKLREDLGGCAPVGQGALKEYLVGCGWSPEDLGFKN